MFFGFEDEKSLRLACPYITDDLIKDANLKMIQVCSRDKNKECWGSFVDSEGKYFIYSDQTRDRGEWIKSYRLKIAGDEYAW